MADITDVRLIGSVYLLVYSQFAGYCGLVVADVTCYHTQVNLKPTTDHTTIIGFVLSTSDYYRF